MRHAAGGSYVPHGPVLLHGVAHELGETLHGVATGQAELFGLRDRTDVVLKVYFAGRNPKARATKEMLERYQAIRSPHLMRLIDFGFGADGLDGEHDWELLERLEEVVAPKDDEARLGWISASVVPAVRAAIDALLSRHLVHCDIKKPNLMARHGTGDLVLVDIGSLKEIDPQNRTSVTTVLSTTTVYAAPELLRHHVNDTTDAFALGMLLLDLVNPALIAPPADKEVVARITENKPVVDVIPTAPRLTDLINGLTRNAVSARWGVGELAIWCSGGTVSKADSARTLPPMRVQGRQITSVDELLSFMQDEQAFWGVCEDEGDLPFTLRQWVNQLHDDEVGAALSRLVKRCLTEGKQEVGLVAMRRVFAPAAPLSVRAREFSGDVAGFVDALGIERSASVEMEVALRLWSHAEQMGAAGRVLRLLDVARDSERGKSRSRVELFTGQLQQLKGWAGAILHRQLREEVGPIPAAEIEAAAHRVLSLVPIGTAAGPWQHDLALPALLVPDEAEHPEIWDVWEAARSLVCGAIVAGQFVLDERVRDLSPARLREIWQWEPGESWLDDVCSEVEGIDDIEEAVQAILWASGRRWLVGDTFETHQPKELEDVANSSRVSRWLAKDASHAARMVAWAKAIGMPTHSEGKEPQAAALLTANRLLWAAGSRSVSILGWYLPNPAELAQISPPERARLLDDSVVLAWLSRLGAPWELVPSLRSVFRGQVLSWCAGDKRLERRSGDQAFERQQLEQNPEPTLDGLLSEQPSLVLGWLDRLSGRTNWNSNSLPAVGEDMTEREFALRIAEKVSLVCPEFAAVVFDQAGHSGTREPPVNSTSFRVLRWNEIATAPLGLVVEADKQGYRPLTCACDDLAECECIWSEALRSERCTRDEIQVALSGLSERGVIEPFMPVHPSSAIAKLLALRTRERRSIVGSLLEAGRVPKELLSREITLRRLSPWWCEDGFRGKVLRTLRLVYPVLRTASVVGAAVVICDMLETVSRMGWDTGLVIFLGSLIVLAHLWGELAVGVYFFAFLGSFSACSHQGRGYSSYWAVFAAIQIIPLASAIVLESFGVFGPKYKGDWFFAGRISMAAALFLATVVQYSVRDLENTYYAAWFVFVIAILVGLAIVFEGVISAWLDAGRESELARRKSEVEMIESRIQKLSGTIRSRLNGPSWSNDVVRRHPLQGASGARRIVSPINRAR